MSDATPPTALVRVRQYGGTYLAGAKIGNAKQINASCTAGDKTAAARAAAKAFGCSEDEIELKNAKPKCVTETGIGKSLFWATQKTSPAKREMISIPIFDGEGLARAVQEHDPRFTPTLVIDDDTWADWFPKIRSKNAKP